MADVNGEFPTVLGPDARFKGELTFEKGVRVLGQFDGHIKSKGTLHVAEGARVHAQVEASNVRVDGEIRGNIICSEKLHLTATSKIEGDLRTARLEMNDGAQFSGNVVVGQQAAEAPLRREPPATPIGLRPTDAPATTTPRVRAVPQAEPATISMPGVPAAR